MDISEILYHEIQKVVNWRNNLFYNFIDDLVSSGFEVNFWEEEYWAAVNYGDDVVGYLYSRKPLFFADIKWKESITSNNKPLVIYVKSLFEKNITCESEVFVNVFGNNIPLDIFSAEDMYFFTN